MARSSVRSFVCVWNSFFAQARIRRREAHMSACCCTISHPKPEGYVAPAPTATGAWPYNLPCAQQYVGKSQSCMVISGRLSVHAPVLLDRVQLVVRGGAAGAAPSVRKEWRSSRQSWGRRSHLAGTLPMTWSIRQRRTVCFHIIGKLETMHD